MRKVNIIQIAILLVLVLLCILVADRERIGSATALPRIPPRIRMTAFPPGITVQFQGKDRYFPSLVYQVFSPVFLWDNFFTYQKDIWGDNQNGNIRTLQKEGFAGMLELQEKQTIWLLYRLSYGSAEFRWLQGLGKARDDQYSDKYFGFGDPAEGFSAGFRLHKLRGDRVELYAETTNQGQAYQTEVPWDPDFENARFFVEWEPDKITYSINTNKKYTVVGVHRNGDIFLAGLPKVRMEISIQNLQGSVPMLLPLVKYDSYAHYERNESSRE